MKVLYHLLPVLPPGGKNIKRWMSTATHKEMVHHEQSLHEVKEDKNNATRHS